MRRSGGFGCRDGGGSITDIGDGGLVGPRSYARVSRIVVILDVLDNNTHVLSGWVASGGFGGIVKSASSL